MSDPSTAHARLAALQRHLGATSLPADGETAKETAC